MRALLAALLMTTGCAGMQCQAVGGGAIGAGSVGGGAVGGGAVGRCSESLPTGIGSRIVDLNAQDMNGNGDGNTGWSNDDAVDSSGKEWVSSGADASTFHQATVADQPVFKDPCPGLGGSGACVYFADDHVVSEGAASLYKDLHDGDHTCYVVFEIAAENPETNQVLYGTSTNSSSIGSVSGYYDASTRENNHLWFVHNGSGTTHIALDASGKISTQVGHTLINVLDSGAAGDDGEGFVDAVSSGTYTEVGSVSASNPTNTLTVGALTGGSLELTGYMSRLVCFDQAHDATTRADVTAALECPHAPTIARLGLPGGCSLPAPGAAESCCPAAPNECKIAAIGDSTTYVYNQHPGRWTEKLEVYLNQTRTERTWSVDNFAAGGARVAAIDTQYDSNVAGNGYQILTMLGGYNDLYNDSADGAATFATLEATKDLAVAASMCVVWMNVYPAESAAAWTSGKQTEHDEFSGLVAAVADSTVELVDTFSILEDPANADDMLAKWDNGDGVHLSLLGDNCIARVAENAI